MAKVSTNISLDSDLKKDAVELLSDFGLDLSTAVSMFLKQMLREQRIPFEIKKLEPNAATMRALRELAEIEKNPEHYKSYSRAEELFDEVFADEV